MNKIEVLKGVIMSSRGKKKKIRSQEKAIKKEQFESSQAEMNRFLKLIESKSGQSCTPEDIVQLIELSKSENSIGNLC